MSAKKLGGIESGENNYKESRSSRYVSVKGAGDLLFENSLWNQEYSRYPDEMKISKEKLRNTYESDTDSNYVKFLGVPLWRKAPSGIGEIMIESSNFTAVRETEAEHLTRGKLLEMSNLKPVPLCDYGRRGNPDTCYLYKSNVYKFNRHYSDEEMIFQIMELEDKERQKFERLKHKFTTAQEEEKKAKREPIPEDVRIAVWRRDEGKCSKCGSREKLEYDHIVPIAKGGSNTARNIELLCEQCNRSKSANIQ